MWQASFKGKSLMNPGRRTALRLLAGSGLLAAASLPASKADAATYKESRPEAAFAVVIDVDACDGCGACVTACRTTRSVQVPVPQRPIPKSLWSWVRAGDWSDRRSVDWRLTPYNWLYIQKCSLVWQGRRRAVYLPRRCFHCLNPQCVSLCPSGALRQEQTGAVHTSPSGCLGAGRCVRACPWFFPKIQAGVGPYLKLMPRLLGSGMSFKCDFCWERTRDGSVPACVQACPRKAQYYGPREEMICLAEKLAAERGGEVFGRYENGGTCLFYVSSVPFPHIEAALLNQNGIGPGKPSLRPAGVSMERENAMTHLLLGAPVFGVGLAALRLWRDRQRERS